MKKIIFTFIVFTNIIFSQEIIVTDNQIKHSIGFGYPGLFFRQHTNDGYLEYIGWLQISQKSKNISFYFNKAQYLNTYINDNLDFALKYVYGADISHRSYSYSENDYTLIGSSVGIGIETISPQKNGIVVDIFMGEELNYFFEDGNFEINPVIRFSILFNY